MMAGAVLAHARIEAHLGRVRPIRGRRQLADLVEAHDLGPEAMRFLDVADVEHEMIDATRCYRLVHRHTPGMICCCADTTLKRSVGPPSDCGQGTFPAVTGFLAGSAAGRDGGGTVGVTGRRTTSGALRIDCRSIFGIAQARAAQHAVGQLVVAVEAAAQPRRARRECRHWRAARTPIRGRRAPRRHGPRPSAAGPRAAARCSRRRRTTPPGPAAISGAARSLSVGATTSDEPGTMRRISAMRCRAFSMAMLPGGEMGAVRESNSPSGVNSGSSSAAVWQLRTVCTSVTRSTRYSIVGSCSSSPMACVQASARPRVNSALDSQQ